MRILITGSRNWIDYPAIRDAIVNVLRNAPGTVHTLIHGNALGADSMADAAARDLGLEIEVYPADWKLHGKRAGFLRNSQMVNLEPRADICLAFIHNDSRGATMCADLAEKAGIPVRRYEVHTGGVNVQT